MTKSEFLDALELGLSSLPKSEVLKSTTYYSEQIEDRIEDGMTQEEAIADLESIDDIIEQIKNDFYQGNPNYSSSSYTSDSEYNDNYQTQQQTQPQENYQNVGTYNNKKNTENTILRIALIVVTFPIWIGFIAAAFGIFIALWSVAISLFAVFIALGISGIVMLFASFFLLAPAGFAGMMLTLGGSLVLCAVSILMFIAAFYSVKGLAKLTVLCCKGIARIFTGRKGA